MEGSPLLKSALDPAPAPTTASKGEQDMPGSRGAPTQTTVPEDQQDFGLIKREDAALRSRDEQAAPPKTGTNSSRDTADGPPPETASTPVRTNHEDSKPFLSPVEPSSGPSGTPAEPDSMQTTSQDGEGLQEEVPPSQLIPDEEILSRLEVLLTEVDLQATTGEPAMQAMHPRHRNAGMGSLAWVTVPRSPSLPCRENAAAEARAGIRDEPLQQEGAPAC